MTSKGNRYRVARMVAQRFTHYYYHHHYYYYYYYYFYSYHESGFLSHIYIKVNRLFTPEEAVKQAQSQQYRHQSDIIGIILLPLPSTPYLFHTPLQSPNFDSKKTNAYIVGIY